MRKSLLVKFLIVTLILGFTSVGILDFGSVKASLLAPNRSLIAPEFIVTFEANPYFEPPAYRIDPFTGENETIHTGYNVENKSIVVRIKNTPFTPYYTKINGSYLELFYIVRAKGHFEDSWTQLSFVNVSNSEYSTKYYIIGTELGYANDFALFKNLSVDDMVDFQVQEQLGVYMKDYGFIPQFGPASSRYPSSDFSEMQTLTISSPQTPTPSPTPITEPFPTTIAVASVVIIAVIGVGILAYFKKHKKRELG